MSARAGHPVWAVGSYTEKSGETRTLIERWNGKSWMQVTSPAPGTLSYLDAVRGDWAVGSYTPTKSRLAHSLIVHWTGNRWRQVMSPSPGRATKLNLESGSFLTGLSSNWAVGSYTTSDTSRTFTLQRSGNTWRQRPSPNPGAAADELLNAVSGNWAVGSAGTVDDQGTGRALILRWDGRSWRSVTSPNPGSQSTLAGLSGDWAVGYYHTTGSDGRTLIAHWTGIAWRQVTSPEPGHGQFAAALLYAVDGNWATGIYANGDKALIVHRIGDTWRQVASPTPGYGNDLTAVSGNWAVGQTGTGHSLIDHWNGTAWTRT